MFMGVLFGLPGVVLATPLAAIALVLVKMLYVEDTLGDPIGQPEASP
jgi:predicted PurR-regulated permease PerM